MSRQYQRVPTADDPLAVHLADIPHNDHIDSSVASPPPPTYVNHVTSPTARTPPPHSIDRQRSDLEEAFGESFDDDSEDDYDGHGNQESQQLLGQQSTSSQPSVAVPVQASSSSNNTSHSRPAILPVTNDGVFSNMAAKPEREGDKLDETPPAYEEAAADATPPYWQTTIIAPPGMGDMILVEGMPVGNLFNFAWNLLVSASFQFVGFMLTYLLHTSHAAKQGSRTGLGITFVQYGFYIRSRGSLDDFELSDGSGDGDTNDTQESTNADIIAYLLMLLGWFIIIRAIGDYIRARKMENIITAEPSPDNIV